MKRTRILGGALLAAIASLVLPVGADAHFEADGLIVERDGQVLVHVWQGVVRGDLYVPFEEASDVFEVTFLDPDSVLFHPDTPDAWLKAIVDAPSEAHYDSVGTWAFTLTGLLPGVNGNVLLRLWFDDHFDYTSPPIPFTVGGAAGIGDEAGAPTLSLTAAPNPTRGWARVEFRLSEDGPVDVGVFDPAGRLVRRLASGVRAAGVHTVWLEPDGLGTGVYFVRLTTPGGNVERKLQVLR